VTPFRFVKKHTSKQDCYHQVFHSLLRDILHPKYRQSFIEQDNAVLASKNLSNRKYAKIFNSDHNALISANKKQEHYKKSLFDPTIEIEDENEIKF